MGWCVEMEVSDATIILFLLTVKYEATDNLPLSWYHNFNNTIICELKEIIDTMKEQH